MDKQTERKQNKVDSFVQTTSIFEKVKRKRQELQDKINDLVSQYEDETGIRFTITCNTDGTGDKYKVLSFTDVDLLKEFYT